MKLDGLFTRLPLGFEVERRGDEVEELSEGWHPDPERSGSSALPLLAGEPVAATEHLKRCDYLLQALAGLETVPRKDEAGAHRAGEGVPRPR